MKKSGINPFATSSIMIDSSITKNLRFRTHLRRRQDYIYWYEALMQSKEGKKVSGVLSKYRVDSENSLSADKKRMLKIQWSLLRDELNVHFIKRIYCIVAYTLNGLKKYFY